MLRRSLWVSMLCISLTAFAQVSAPPSQDNTNTPAVNALPGGYGTVWTGPGAASGVLLTTPSASFGPLPNTAGISNAGRAGISNGVALNTAQAGPPSGLYVYAPYSPAAEPPAVEEAPAEKSVSDLLPSYYGDNLGAPAGNGPSLAEIAAQYAARRGTTTAGLRTYTNSDVPRENAGLLNKIWLAEGRLPAATQDSTQLMASASSPRRPLTSEPVAHAQSNAPSQNEQAQPASRSGELPASATILPLLGLLGLASGGLGLWLKRRRV